MNQQYVAGLFDGEGSIFTWVGYNNSPHLDVSITNYNEELLDKLWSFYGGKIIARYGKNIRWHLSKREDQLRFLRDVLPHVVVKKRLTELAKVFLNLNTRPGCINQKATSSVKVARDWRVIISEEITRLNNADQVQNTSD